MAPLAVTSYSVVVAIHVMSIVGAFGVVFAFPALVGYAERSHPEALSYVWSMLIRVSRMFVTPFAVVALVAGIYLATDADVWSESWVSGPLILWIVILGVLHAFMIPRARRAAELAPGGGESRTSDYSSASRAFAIAAGVNSVLVLAAIFLMVVKP